jgi:hypothetical protein
MHAHNEKCLKARCGKKYFKKTKNLDTRPAAA